MVYFFFKRLCACKCFPHSRSLNNQQQKVEQVSTAYGAQTHTRPETNPSLGALDSLPDFRESDGSCNLPVFLMSLFPSHCHLMCLPYFSHLSIRRAGAGPGGTSVRGLHIAGVPTSARHAAATGWGFTGCARQRHHCARDQCV